MCQFRNSNRYVINFANLQNRGPIKTCFWNEIEMLDFLFSENFHWLINLMFSSLKHKKTIVWIEFSFQIKVVFWFESLTRNSNPKLCLALKWRDQSNAISIKSCLLFFFQNFKRLYVFWIRNVGQNSLILCTSRNRQNSWQNKKEYTNDRIIIALRLAKKCLGFNCFHLKVYKKSKQS